MLEAGGRTQILLVVGLIFLAGCGGALPGDPTADDGEAAGGPTVETTTANGTVEVHYINVGQSVSTLIIGPDGSTMLVDTGHYNDDGEYVLQYLKAQDINRIDHLVTSHNDADHIGGNADVIEYFETEANGIGEIYDPGIAASTQTYEEYLDAVETHDVTLYETREGDTIDFGTTDVAVLGPPDPHLENRARNENSIVLKITHGETSFLLSGDAEDDQEAYLVDTYGNQLESTVLKAGHHGSSSSSSEPFLDTVAPQTVVISSAYDSRYGHPTETVLQRFADRSIPAFWTATHGNTVFVSNGTAVSVQTQQTAPTNPAALRDGSAISPGTTGAVSERLLLTGDGTPPVDVDDSERTDSSDEETTTADGSATNFEIADINADAEGDDRENLNGEYVTFENTGEQSLDISGWMLEDASGRSYTVPDGVTVDPQATITVRTGSGTNSDTDLYWGSGSPIWNNGGDTIIVQNADGNTVLEETY